VARLDDWFLAVQLLMDWDDRKNYSAEIVEQTLTKFLDNDAKKHRITPRLTSELFLRGILRTLWDVDRLLKVMNPGDDLKRFARSPLVLSILRVMAYECMWMPTGTARTVVQSAVDLMEKCSLSAKSEREWISGAVSRMWLSFEKSHLDWERKRRAREEEKRRKKREQAAAGGEQPEGAAGVVAADDQSSPAAAVVAARPKGGAVNVRPETRLRLNSQGNAATNNKKATGNASQGAAGGLVTDRQETACCIRRCSRK